MTLWLQRTYTSKAEVSFDSYTEDENEENCCLFDLNAGPHGEVHKVLPTFIYRFIKFSYKKESGRFEPVEFDVNMSYNDLRKTYSA